MIDRFTKEQFEQALPGSWEYVGFVSGEHTYKLNVGGSVYIYARSSVGMNGIADDTAEDSIRIYLNDDGNRAKFVHVESVDGSTHYVTRVTGWPERMNKLINILMSLRQQTGNCKECGAPLSVNRGRKPGKFMGKLFGSCANYSHNSFKVINPLAAPVAYEKFDWSFGAMPVQSLTGLRQPKPIKEMSEEEDPASTLQLSDDIFNIFPRKEVVVSQINLSNLDMHQLKIVDNGCNGPSVVEAVPGSGKTHTLSYLVASMIAKGQDPSRILCCTFSVKGAEEMRVRLAKLIWSDISDEEIKFFGNPKIDDENGDFNQAWVDSDPIRKFLVSWVCTIHAVCNRLLKASGRKFRLSVDNIERDAMQIIKDYIEMKKWEETPKSVRSYISVAAIKGVPMFKSYAFFYALIESRGGNTYFATHMSEVYKEYCMFLRKQNAMDFDQLQYECLRLLREDATFRGWASSLFDKVILDEGQDTTPEQFEIVCALAAAKKNMMIIGDVDQSMYAFRGAVPEVLRSVFEKRWNSSLRFTLPVNRRSGKNIVSLSAKFIGNNYAEESQKKYMKEFQAKDDAPDGEVTQSVYETFDDLASDIAVQIQQEGHPGNWFVLSRTRAECAAIHSTLIARGIPAINKSGGFLLGAGHIRKVIAYMKLAVDHNGARNDLDILSEVANVATVDFIAPMTRRSHREGCTNKKFWVDCGCPTIMQENVDHSHSRYYGRESIQAAGSWAGVERQQYEETQTGHHPTMRSKGARDLVQFVHSLEYLADNAAGCATKIINDCVLPWFMAEKGADINDVESSEGEDFAVLTQMIEDHQSVVEFLDEIDALTSKSKNGSAEKESVLVGTIHWSKGAERPCVVANLTRCPCAVPYLGPGKLPPLSDTNIEEERRLAYVAVTRAKEIAHVLAAKEWLGKEIQPSQFLTEIFGVLEDRNLEPNITMESEGDLFESE
jgi:DNA helicase II / ATP-dependent DNA helicase PcrA